MSTPHRHILGMRVDSGNYDSMTNRICDWASREENRYVCVSNVHMTMETVDSDAFRDVVNSADMVTSDGMPLVWMLRKLGLPESERVYGPELVLRVCERSERLGIPIGLYGGTDESLERFTTFLGGKYPDLAVVYRWAPPFRPLTDKEDADMVTKVAESGARILFVGIGCPKQERFMAAHKDRIQAVQIGVGAAFDFHSGAVKQAPSWMGRSGLEWLFRLMMEPKRLWRRYAIHNPRFMMGAAKQLLTGYRHLAAAAVLALVVISGLLATGFHSPASYSRTVYVDQAHPQASDSNPGSVDRPYETISAALADNALLPGDRILVAGGIYREKLNPKVGGRDRNARLTIEARNGEEVVISGADPIGAPDFLSGTTWVVNNYFPLDFYGDDYVYQRELVIADGQALKPVFDRSNLVPGTFFVDRFTRSSGRILIDTGSTQAPELEIARRGALFFPGNPYANCGDPEQPTAFRLVGLTFRHAANAAQYGAVCVGGMDTLLEDVTVEWSVGTGIQVIGTGHRLINVRSNHHGQTGINGSCVGCSLVDTHTSYNNFVGHDVFWEAGGGKWSHSSDVQFLRHTAVGNDGPGLWLDGDNSDITVSYSLFDNNLAAGVFIELDSWGVVVERVTISSTRRHGWTGAGILLQSTGGASLRDNHLIANDGAGIWARRDDRAESGFNSIERNLFESNVRVPDQDRAALQIDAWTHIELCSNFVSENEMELGQSYRFSVDETGQTFEADSLDHYSCLVDYSGG